MVECTGWLLDLYEDPLGGLVLWLLDDNGSRRRLRQRFPVTFYAAGPAGLLQALETWLEKQAVPARCWPDQRVDAFVGKEIPVLAIEAQRPADVGSLYRQASRAFSELTFSDADLQLSLRYTAAHGVAPLGRCKVALDPACGAGDFIQSITALDSPWDLDPCDPPLRVLSLEPECDPSHAAPRAVRIQAGSEAFSLALSPARPLLVTLRALLVDYDPDLLLTTWGDTWLLPRLLAMAEKSGLPLPLNRDADAVISYRKERWYFSYGQIVYRGEQVHLFGRWHVDRRNAMMWTDYQLNGMLETARVTGLPLQTAARVSPGTGISSIQMQTALRLGILVPCQKQQVEELKPAWDLFAADQGGLVYRPIVGVHRDVAEIDFVSLYPAIMVYCNISPGTIGRAAGTASRASAPLNAAGPAAENVPGLRLAINRSREGLVPQALRPLLKKRVALKERLAEMPAWDARRGPDKSRAAALKWLLVTCFGYLGYKNARFGRIEAHQAVTAFGREALLSAKETAEDRGFMVLHLYVDALWVRAEGKSQAGDLKDLLAEIQARSGLPIALDGIYRWVVFLASRQNANRPVANRYFGVYQSGEIKARGIAARRRDTPVFIARVQGELIECLARAPEPQEALPQAIALLHRRLADLHNVKSAQSTIYAGSRGVRLEDLLVAQRITREVEDYRSPSPAARAARQLKQIGKVMKPGQRVRFLFTLGKPGVYAWDLPARPNPATVDVPRYLELLQRAANEVLEPFLGEMGQGETIQS